MPIQQAGTFTSGIVPAPEWIIDAILYEIATRSFTSPNGPESGTFQSLRAKLPYVHDLGATVIWLTGHSLAHPTHFYNIWTQYACIEPGVLDPALGSEQDFRQLIDEAHRLGIRVILDVITHGVMSSSPLITQHPNWFKGGSWGMTDFDWEGHHPDLDDWWVDVWAGYVEKYGIDGFRLDVATYRWDLWQRIRQRATTVGHPIIIATEHGPGHIGVNDFFQRASIRLSDQRLGLNTESPLLHDVAAFIRQAVTPFHHAYYVRIENPTGVWITGDATLRIVEQQVEQEVVRDKNGKALSTHYAISLDVLGVDSAQPVEEVVVDDGENQEWHLQPWGEVDSRLTVETIDKRLRLRFVAKYPPGQWLAVQLSSHDDGWDGFPLDKNPYVAQGSRCVFGYAFLLTPTIPLFMAGEEFAAEYRPLPALSPNLFGGAPIGQGRWLYGSWIDWNQLENPQHAAMLEDVKRLIAIRKRFSHLIYALRVGDSASHLLTVPTDTNLTLPKPYLYYNKREALLIAGNPNRNADAAFHFQLPWQAMGWQPDTILTVDNLWQVTDLCAVTVAEFASKEWKVPRDGTALGGMLVLHLTKKE